MTFTFNEMSSKEILRARLGVLRQEHRALDEKIHSLGETEHMDSLEIRRLKKHKLMLKDQIVRLEDQITPDIIA